MDEQLQAIITRHASPLEPEPTDQFPVLRPLPNIKAVLLDIYGTLFISASGDIGTLKSRVRSEAFEEALAAVGIGHRAAGVAGVERLAETILHFHRSARVRGIEFPEVDMLEVWQRTLRWLAADGMIETPLPTSLLLPPLAVEYEMRTNPVWPMPGVEECLQSLRSADIILGLISNAQSFTPELFPALLGADPQQLGFHGQLQFLSYIYRQAKPGLFLFERAREALERICGIAPGEVLYIGNDMLNDVYPAHRIGFHTALFAGDQRSLRLRSGDKRIEGLTPDLIITHLSQLSACLLPT